MYDFETELGAYLYDKLAAVDGVEIYGPPPNAASGRAGLAAFNVKGMLPNEVSTLLNAGGVVPWDQLLQ